MNVNVYAVTIEGFNTDSELGNRVVVASEVPKQKAEEIARMYRDELGYDDVRVECWA